MKKFFLLLLVLSFVLFGGLPFGVDESSSEPTFNFHGQFRVNSYADSREDKTMVGDFNRTASRLRWRPTFDVEMSESVSLHTQFNIGHINSNIANAGTSFALRHAVIQADLFDTGITGVAGLVPVSDKFGDTLFSADWDYNPLALIFLVNKGDVKIRAGLGTLQEGVEGGLGGGSALHEDDLSIYVFDADYEPLGIGGSVYWMNGGSDRGIAAGKTALGGALGGGAMQELSLFHYGGRYSGDFEVIKVNAFLVGSNLTADGFFGAGADLKSNGVAGKIEIIAPINDVTVGLMITGASGDKNFGVAGTGTSSAFITPMSVAGTTGYWGYTGRLTEQGPTDTGIDDQTVNLDGGGLPWSSYANLGLGLLTVQGKVGFPITDIIGAYFGVGYYRSADAPAGQSKDIGLDVYAQAKINLGQNLNLEAGVDYLAAGKGHYNNIAAATASGLAVSRGIFLGFSRLQLEY